MSGMHSPGLIALFGSGETSPSGRKVHDYLFARLPPPVRVAILETPAGFQPNSALVAEKIKLFLEHHLQNYHPEVALVPARRRDGELGANSPAALGALEGASYVFAGPGSPTYAVRHLRETLAYRLLLARHAAGASLAFASAAAIAFGAWTLPVYEIFKVGDDLHWVAGLDLFGRFGLELAVVTHWNNHEGGRELDTTCCYMGQERFAALRAMLPASTVVLGVDEHTAGVLDLGAGSCLVLGNGGVTVVRGDESAVYPSGTTFELAALRS